MIESSIGTVVLGAPSTCRRLHSARACVPPAPRLAVDLLFAGHAVASLFVALTHRQAIVTFAVLSIVGALAAAAAVVDLVEERIPNTIVQSIAAVVGLALVIDPSPFVAVLASTASAGLPLLLVRLGRGIGMGDVKFAVVLGAAGGLAHPLVGLVTVFVAAAASGTFAVVTRRTRLALAPWLWGGFVVALTLVHALAAIGDVR